ncbi:hypothetical protein PLUTE_b0582 [Pseudoalteromonas luteoviolacea DSM 6061]|nr:hypothetical protein [Pseudoalteromonas luteoviolacea DSM 6061]
MFYNLGFILDIWEYLNALVFYQSLRGFFLGNGHTGLLLIA